jgi:sugar lactone lactonase YvrE
MPFSGAANSSRTQLERALTAMKALWVQSGLHQIHIDHHQRHAGRCDGAVSARAGRRELPAARGLAGELGTTWPVNPVRPPLPCWCGHRRRDGGDQPAGGRGRRRHRSRAAAAHAGQRGGRRDLARARPGRLVGAQAGHAVGQRVCVSGLAAQAGQRTLCHLDVWPANLIDDDGTSVLLDWAFAGEGAVGEDVANLIVDSFADGLMDVRLLPELAESVTDRYLEGLRDGGWSGSDDAVRFAIAACGAAKYGWLGPARAGSAARDDIGQASYARDTPAASVVHRLTSLVRLIAGWSALVMGEGPGIAACHAAIPGVSHGGSDYLACGRSSSSWDRLIRCCRAGGTVGTNEVRTLADGRGLVESPRWHGDRLYFSDWSAGEVVAVDLAGRSELIAQVESLPLCTAWLPDGHMVIVSSPQGRLLRREADGSLVTHTDLGRPGWNDIVVDGRGNAYVNRAGFNPAAEEAFQPGSVFLAAADGSVRQVADDIAFPNGMAVTGDNSTLIVADSYRHHLVGFDIGADGMLSGRRVWAGLGDGAPDGICADAQNAVWYADVPGKRCVRVAEGGAVLQTVRLASGGFACTLGGPEGTTLFIAAAEWRGMTESPMVVPGSGKILIADVDVPHAGWP